MSDEYHTSMYTNWLLLRFEASSLKNLFVLLFRAS